MFYSPHNPADLHNSRSYSYLRTLGVTKFSVNVLYYLISYYIFLLFVFTFEIPLVYRVTGTLESILLSHLLFFFFALVGFITFYILRLKFYISSLFRISMLFNFLISLYLLISYNNLTSLNAIYIIFILRGLGVSAFAIAFHAVFIDGLKDKQRDSFSLFFRSIYTVLPIFIPVLAGNIISNSHLIPSFFNITNSLLPSGYFIIFLIGALLSFSFTLYAPKIKLSEDFSGGIIQPIKLLFTKRIAPIRNYLIFNAGVDSLKIIIYGLLGFLILTTELNLGIFSSILAFIGSLYFLAVNKLEKSMHVKRIKFFFLGLLGDLATQVGLLFGINIISLAIRAIASTLITPLKAVFGINMIRKRYDSLSTELHIPKISFILFQEMSYFIGRVFTFAFMFFIIVFVTRDLQTIFKIALLFFIIVDIVEYFFIKEIRKI